MRRFLVVMGAVLFVTPGAVARASVPIQPGMFIRTTTNGCTANFVFDGIGAEAGRVYLGTAAHCVGANGDAVLDEDGQAIGKVAAHGDGSIDADDHRDWALFEVPASQVARVDPSVVGHPQMPRGGLPDAAHVAAGDAVQFSGFGQLWVTPGSAAGADRNPAGVQGAPLLGAGSDLLRRLRWAGRRPRVRSRGRRRLPDDRLRPAGHRVRDERPDPGRGDLTGGGRGGPCRPAHDRAREGRPAERAARSRAGRPSRGRGPRSASRSTTSSGGARSSSAATGSSSPPGCAGASWS